MLALIARDHDLLGLAAEMRCRAQEAIEAAERALEAAVRASEVAERATLNWLSRRGYILRHRSSAFGFIHRHFGLIAIHPEVDADRNHPSAWTATGAERP